MAVCFFNKNIRFYTDSRILISEIGPRIKTFFSFFVFIIKLIFFPPHA